MKSFNLAREFVVLSPDKVVRTHVNSPQFYADLDKDYADFAGHELIALHEFDADWPSWEVHPHGDETVVLLSGSAIFVLHLEESNQKIELSEPGDTVVVPRGIWHTAKISRHAKMLFITPGQGTLNDSDMAKFERNS